ncbi:disintegrin and metalloproteinase domain-containing protein 10 [Trichonephila clavipes]|nr:disintegrin and metalloproteinase domain-containing protein 10 [Trichonephila clavipes]
MIFFPEIQDSICGNGVVEKNEQCDCGWEEDCEESCCFPMRTNPPRDEPPCMLRPNVICSPSQGPCCSHDCSLKIGEECRGSSCHHTGNDCGSESFLVLDNRRITMSEIHRLLGISVGGTTHTIMHQHLNFRKICAQWVPNQLTAEQRNTRMALSLSHLQRYHEEEYDFLSQIVTGDETWGHHFEPGAQGSKGPKT